MTEKRHHYNEIFKEDTVRYLQQQTKSLPDIAEELNIPVGTLRNWLQKYRKFPDEPINNSERVRELEQQIQELERKNQALESDKTEIAEENAIIKKAMYYFSKDRK